MATRTLAFVNLTRGVGKTTLALNVAAALGKRGSNTLLVEGDTATRFSAEATLSDSGLALDRDAREVIRATKYAGLSVLCGYGSSVATGGAGHAAERLRRVENQFDTIVFDTPGGDPGLAKEILRLADHVIIPVRADKDAIQTLPETLRLLLEARAVNPSLSVMGFTLSMGQVADADPSVQVSLKQIFGVYRTLQFSSEIRFDRQVSAAMESLTPIVHSAASTSAASGFLALTEEINGRLPTAAAASSRRITINRPEMITPIGGSAPSGKVEAGKQVNVTGLLNWISGLFGKR